MKRILKQILFSAIVLSVFASCKKDEKQVIYEGGTAPVLSTSKTGEIPLSFKNQNDEAITFNWTNPDYKLSTGISSQDVNYILEIDTAGSNFTNPNIKRVAVSKDLGATFTQGQFNDFLLNQLVLTPGRKYNIEARVISSLINNSAKLTSNKVEFSATPYAIPPKVEPPTSGELFITGAATPSSWMSGGDSPVPSQKFTQKTPTLYELASIDLNGGQSYLFVPVYGDWSNKYGFTGEKNKNNPESDDFKKGGEDFIAPPASGKYKIVVDFQRGKYIITKL